ncbi:dipeptidyl-peptidase III [Penicillium herquei]|nr:dipeptidyl-peptidase III [Penicillium herquei]
MDFDQTNLFADKSAPICAIPISQAFAGLSDEEKIFAHHMCRASFHGTRILLRQTSQESEAIYDLIISLYRAGNGDWEELGGRTNVSNEDVDDFLDYASMFLGNVGNYRSTGDTKFIPRICRSTLKQLCSVNSETEALFEAASQGMYSTMPYKYGYPEDITSSSGYYPGDNPISKVEIDSIQRFLQDNNILPENTRVSKIAQDDTAEFAAFSLHLASATSLWEPELVTPTFLDLPENPPISVQSGDFADCLEKVIAELQCATLNCTNPVTLSMIDSLVESFRSGNHNEFKAAQTNWVLDRSPNVETVIGFIETYQDPHGVRGAWEGIVAIVNKEQTRKFSELVDSSPQLIPLLPWNGLPGGVEDGLTSIFENETFQKPDFTSVDTLGFVKSESPAGLNLPNFEEICQNFGFKNLQFGNVNNANPPDESMPFIMDHEQEFLRQNREMAFEVIVACHELLGHGSGRLLVEESAGKFNFPIDERPLNPLTNQPVSSWYKPGETWSNVFGADANAIEECRADGVALLLLTEERVLGIFGYTENLNSRYLASNVMYSGYLITLFSALKGLSRWNPETKGKFALLKCLMECGDGLLEMLEIDNGLKIRLDRSKIKSHAVPALSRFLLHLQTYKSTANVKDGVAFLNRYTDVDTRFANYRDIVVREEPLRTQYVQPNTFRRKDDIFLQEYPASKQGLIQSWAERDI